MAPSAKDRRLAWEATAFFLGEGGALPRGFDPQLVGELARVHRLDAALVEPRLTPVSPEPHIPAAVWQSFQEAHSAALLHAVRRESRLREALASLAPLPVIVLKGAAFGELLYPNPAARGMADVDVLVRAEHLDEALNRLAPLGYERHLAGHPVYDDPAFHERQLTGPLDLDVHQAFLQTAWFPLDYAGVFERAVPWLAFASNAFVLAPPDSVVYACIELVKDVGAAVGLLDLLLMLRREGPFWGSFGPPLDRDAVGSIAHAFGAERMVHVALSLLQTHFPSAAAAVARVRPHLPPVVRLPLDRLIVARGFPPRVDLPTQSELWVRRLALLRPRAKGHYVTSNLPRLLGRVRGAEST